jgi:hypothetical protein
MHISVHLFFVGLFPFALPVATSHAAAQLKALPVFEPGPCPDHLMSGTRVECGAVVVSQDRLRPEAGTVRIAVAVFKARSSAHVPDPLLFLDGAPGARTLDSYADGWGGFLGQINRLRDIILFDYRGVCYSHPALTCPERLESPDDGWVSLCRSAGHRKHLSLGDRLKFRVSVALGVWSEGDHRDWDAIRAWARALKSVLEP